MKEYWNDSYWEEKLQTKKENMDFLTDIWANKYIDIINTIPKGNALDLGCGLGQYTKYLMDKGFNVTSADISIKVLEELKKEIPNANTLELDMSKPLPFDDNTFDLVLANLSIHYFDTKTTIALLKELKRIIKPNGYFIGTVNSSKTFKFIKDIAKELEPNYYYEYGRTVRLWNKEQFDYFFKDFELEALEEIETSRWNKVKILWEFVAKNKK